MKSIFKRLTTYFSKIDNIDNLIAVCFFIGGTIANFIGFIIDVKTFNPKSIISIINVASTGIGLLAIVSFFFCYKEQFLFNI